MRVACECWCCEACGFRWGLADPGAKPPKRCANPECRSRRWNAGENIPRSLDFGQVAAGLIARARRRRERAEERENLRLAR
jgi:hypothetical protein